MEITEITNQIWDDLSVLSTNKSSNMAMAQSLTFEGNARYYICLFISADGSMNMLIEPSRLNQKKLMDPGIAGLSISILSNHLVEGRERQDYYDIKCNSTIHKAAFTEVIKEIASMILANGVEPEKSINITIQKWRSFWNKPVNQIMSENDQAGLLGELIVLNRILMNIAMNPLLIWTGPEAGIHDFELYNLSIEVKATQKNVRKHIINGLNQLMKCGKKDLIVISFLFQKTENGGTSIVDLVNKIQEVLIEYPDYYDGFNTSLANTGYRYEHGDSYRKTRFIIYDTRVYPVDEGFPRLIIENLSPRITEISYALDFEGLTNYKYDSSEFNEILCDALEGSPSDM